jgi:hypothetical protein
MQQADTVYDELYLQANNGKETLKGVFKHKEPKARVYRPIDPF